ncbi:hypothetical protein, partial [Lactococcus petauri]|uniref:hypothetical protein n=1 Tax=Lactococcus petauri TaxID=1940789 RepID=UPI0021F15E2E
MNAGFENDAGSLNGWTVSTFLNDTIIDPVTGRADLQLAAGGVANTFARTNAVPQSQLASGMVAGTSVPMW